MSTYPIRFVDRSDFALLLDPELCPTADDRTSMIGALIEREEVMTEADILREMRDREEELLARMVEERDALDSLN
jgi:hypothetical protein